MFSKTFIDDLAKRLCENLPSGVKSLKEDLEKNFRAVLQTAFGKLNLVTREEFDAQKGVLTKTRAKLEALEKLVHAMEKGKKKTTTNR